MSGDRRAAFGLRGERIAAALLVARGYRVLGRRVATPAGEVDLVCRRGGALVVVEVKRRRRGGGRAAIGWQQEQRLRRAAGWLVRGAPWATSVRVDLVAIEGLRVRHVRNALHPDDRA